MFTRWFVAITTSLIAAGLWQLTINGDRLTRVEERQQFVIEKLSGVILELQKHERETTKP